MTIAARRLALLGGAAVSLLAAAAHAAPAPAAPPAVQNRAAAAALPALPDVDIPFTKMVLPNGLTLIVHEDHKAPIVAVNIWYHVGSKNEPVGRSGFAHLFEHLMFNGSENFNNDFFKATELLGATDQNGTTNTDRTNYFQNVPTSALDSVLWLESDRMGHLLGAIDQARLDEQRGVVQNEKRQGENQPYGRVWDAITEATYPADHPYGHTVIGSMADLDAASLDDVKGWFRDYYGAANATIVLAGDITPEEARAKVEHYFGDIPSGPPVTQPQRMIARMEGAQREVMYDRVGQPRLYKVWNVPPTGDAATDYLGLLGQVLSSGRTSRLHKRLVFDDQVATSVFAGTSESEIGSQFLVMVTAKPGQDLGAIERVVDEEMARLLRDGPSAEELERARTVTGAGLVRGLERIGGFGGTSDRLAEEDQLRAPADRHARQPDGRGPRLADGRQLCPGSSALPRLHHGGDRRGSFQDAGPRRRAPGRLPQLRAFHPVQRAEGGAGPAHGRADRQHESDRRGGLGGRSGGQERRGSAGPCRHDQWHRPLERPADQRPVATAGGLDRRGFGGRLHQRLAERDRVAAGAVAGPLR